MHALRLKLANRKNRGTNKFLKALEFVFKKTGNEIGLRWVFDLSLWPVVGEPLFERPIHSPCRRVGVRTRVDREWTAKTAIFGSKTVWCG